MFAIDGQEAGALSTCGSASKHTSYTYEAGNPQSTRPACCTPHRSQQHAYLQHLHHLKKLGILMVCCAAAQRQQSHPPVCIVHQWLPYSTCMQVVLLHPRGRVMWCLGYCRQPQLSVTPAAAAAGTKPQQALAQPLELSCIPAAAARVCTGSSAEPPAGPSSAAAASTTCSAH